MDILTPKPDPYELATQAKNELILYECVRRQRLYETMTPQPNLSAMENEHRAGFCLETIETWSRDLETYQRDILWAPDPKGLFGGLGQLKGYAPRMMVPFMASKAQRRIAVEVAEAILSQDEDHVNMVKARQVAATTQLLGVFEWVFRFKAGRTGALSSKDEDNIDKGGSAHRDVSGLFPRLRMIVDAICWGLPHLRYNLHRSEKWIARRADENPSLFTASQDMGMKMVRPIWTVFGQRLYDEAEGNLITGAVPGATFKEGDIMTYVFFDEYPLYNEKRPGLDRASRDAVEPATSTIITIGTIPRDGGLTSDLKALADDVTNPSLRNLTIDWSDVFVYMTDAYFKCRDCLEITPYHPKGQKPEEFDSPGEAGIERTCRRCGSVQVVSRFSMNSIPDRFENCDRALQPGEVSSSWWKKKMATLRFDKTSIARFYCRAWLAAVGVGAFPGFDPVKQIIRPSPKKGERRDGFDPGHSTKNPAAWGASIWDPETQTPRIVAWHMAADWPIQKWIPFMKGWHPRQLGRMRIIYGSPEEVGKTFSQVYSYTDEELVQMELSSRHPPDQNTTYEGDAYGKNRDSGTDAAYEILAHYGIRFSVNREKKRAEWVAKAQNVWMKRLRIEQTAADHLPRHAKGSYIRIHEAIQTAQMVSTEGQSDPVYDISAKEPNRMVKHIIDFLLYIFRTLPEVGHAVVNPVGEYEVDKETERVTVVDRNQGAFPW